LEISCVTDGVIAIQKTLSCLLSPEGCHGRLPTINDKVFTYSFLSRAIPLNSRTSTKLSG